MKVNANAANNIHLLSCSFFGGCCYLGLVIWRNPVLLHFACLIQPIICYYSYQIISLHYFSWNLVSAFLFQSKNSEISVFLFYQSMVFSYCKQFTNAYTFLKNYLEIFNQNIITWSSNETTDFLPAYGFMNAVNLYILLKLFSSTFFLCVCLFIYTFTLHFDCNAHILERCIQKGNT